MPDDPKVQHDSPVQPSTADLVRAARAGDPPGLEMLITRYHHELLQRIRWLMGPEARAVAESRDFVQQMLVDALAQPDRIPRDDAEFLAWLTRIARNNIADAVRHKRELAFTKFSEERQHRDSTGETPDHRLQRDEAQEQILTALTKLPPDRQTVIELREFEGLSFQAIAARMNRSATAVERLHARAVLQLGGLLRKRDACNDL